MVILSVWVGRRTGPLARRSLLLARSMISLQTFSRMLTFLEVRVMRILWLFCGEDVELAFFGLFVALFSPVDYSSLSCARSVVAEDSDTQVWSLGSRTGASPWSLSCFWYDMLAVLS